MTPAAPGPLLAGAVLLGGAAQPWPVDGCACVTCAGRPAGVAGLAVGGVLTLDGAEPDATAPDDEAPNDTAPDDTRRTADAIWLATGTVTGVPTDARLLAVGDQVSAGPLRVVGLPGPVGAGPGAVTAVLSDGTSTLLWAPGCGALPDATLAALAGAGLTVAVVDLRDPAGRARATEAAHRLADLRRVEALAPGAVALAIGLDHTGPAALRVAADLAVHGITLALGGERPAALPAARPAPTTRRTLVLGPASSGKSAAAEHLLGGRPAVEYAATGPAPDAADADWAAKVAAHRDRRPAGWTTVEAAGPGALADLLRSPGPPVLLDSLGTWVAAVLGRAGAWDDPPTDWRPAAEAEVADLVDAWRSTPRVVVAVGEEVGWGVVPPTRAGRLFAEALGELTQRLAAQTERALLVVAGRTLDLDPGGSA